MSVDSDTFWRRVTVLYNRWRSGEGWPSQCDSIVVVHGKAAEDDAVTRASALHIWLCTYELPLTVIAFTATTVVMVATKKKGLSFHLHPLE